MEPATSSLASIAAALTAAVAIVVAVPMVMLSAAVFAVNATTAIVLTGCAQGGAGGGDQIVDQQPVGADSMEIARTIVEVVQQRRLPRRAAVLAVATGLVESGLRNLPYGDRDSLGVFQQRPSQGWGTPAQILNPVYATNTFLDHLLAIPGWDTLPPGEAEQAVQRSGFPDRYAPREKQAADIVAKFWTGPDNPAPVPGLPGTAAPVALTRGCPDSGGSDIPIDPGTVDPKKLPPDYHLPPDPRHAAAVSYALAQLGKPYRWGAKGPDAYDCSGLMLAAWAAAGVGIPAGTLAQIRAGHAVGALSQVQPGDLLFTPGSYGTPQNPRHVGMYAGHNLIVDAYDDAHGVILHPLSAWSAQIVAIRRVADPSTPSPPPGGSPQP